MPYGVSNQDIFNNAQFQNFVEFAQTSKAGSIAKTTTTPIVPDGKPHSITGTSESFIGRLFRSDATKQANNYTRTIFKESVAKMFGGEKYIPDSVKDAMKMNDFEKGRPLTARRILAVKAAIDQIAEKFNGYVSTCQEKLKKDLDSYVSKTKTDVAQDRYDEEAKAENIVKTAFAACKGNIDAMDIVKDHIQAFIYSGDSSVRSEASVQKKVDGLLSNLNELKELSKQNPAIYAAGKQMLMETGTAFPQGMISKLVQACNEAPINDLRKLSASSDAVDINDVTIQMSRSIKNAMKSAGTNKLEASDQTMAAQNFTATVILSRCSKNTLQNIRGALDTEDTSKLMTYYDITQRGDNVHLQDESEKIQIWAQELGDVGKFYLNMIDMCVNRNLDRLEPAMQHNSFIKDFKGDLDVNDIGGRVILDRTISQASEISEGVIGNCINSRMGGTGQAEEELRQVFMDKIGDSTQPDTILKQRMSANANAMINWTICGEMKKLSNGDYGQFAKDVDRTESVTLKNGKMEIKLSRKMTEAQNQLAQFITGDEKATYNSLSAKDKNKVHFMMAMINQETEKAGEMGVQIAMDAKECETAFGTWGITDRKTGQNIGTRTFSFEINNDGGISMHYVMDKPISAIQLENYYNLDEGSSYKSEMEYSLSGDEFNRIADLDFSKFDDKGTTAVFSKKADHRLMNVIDSLPQEFKIEASCNVDMSMKVITGADD